MIGYAGEVKDYTCKTRIYDLIRKERTIDIKFNFVNILI